jgi:hypothetical protein
VDAMTYGSRSGLLSGGSFGDARCYSFANCGCLSDSRSRERGRRPFRNAYA